MRVALGLAALMLLAACKGGGDPVEQAVRETAAANHSAAAQETARVEPVKAETPAAVVCDIEVTFGSYGGGVDGALRESVRALTSNNPDVVSAENTPWGREGESTLCVRTKDAATANRIYGAIAAQIPQVSARAPTSVRHRDGRSRASTYPTTP